MPHSLKARLSGLRHKQIISDKDYDRLCAALDNEDVLDKIRTEIEEANTYDGIYIDRAYVLEIVNKYRKGSDEE